MFVEKKLYPLRYKIRLLTVSINMQSETILITHYKYYFIEQL